MKRILVSLLAIVLLSGCSYGPDGKNMLGQYNSQYDLKFQEELRQKRRTILVQQFKETYPDTWQQKLLEYDAELEKQRQAAKSPNSYNSMVAQAKQQYKPFIDLAETLRDETIALNNDCDRLLSKNDIQKQRWDAFSKQLSTKEFAWFEKYEVAKKDDNNSAAEQVLSEGLAVLSDAHWKDFGDLLKSDATIQNEAQELLKKRADLQKRKVDLMVSFQTYCQNSRATMPSLPQPPIAYQPYTPAPIDTWEQQQEKERQRQDSYNLDKMQQSLFQMQQIQQRQEIDRMFPKMR